MNAPKESSHFQNFLRDQGLNAAVVAGIIGIFGTAIYKMTSAPSAQNNPVPVKQKDTSKPEPKSVLDTKPAPGEFEDINTGSSWFSQPVQDYLQNHKEPSMFAPPEGSSPRARFDNLKNNDTIILP